MGIKSCCFGGNSPAGFFPVFETQLHNADRHKNVFQKEIKKIIRRGVTHFYCGTVREIDLCAVEMLLSLKKQDSRLHMQIVFACEEEKKQAELSGSEFWDQVFTDADEIIVLSKKKRRGGNYQRNCFLVEQSGFMIACTSSKFWCNLSVYYAEWTGVTIIRLPTD